MPSGMPTSAAMAKACSVRLTVTRKSVSSGPPSRPVTSVTTVSAGAGSRMALMKPKRTTKSHTRNSSSGPSIGRARAQGKLRGAAGAAVAAGGLQGTASAGVAIASALVEEVVHDHLLLEDALLGEQVVE